MRGSLRGDRPLIRLAGAARQRSTFSHKGRREERLRYPFTTRRQCSHAARIKFSLASGVLKLEWADRVTLEGSVSDGSAGAGALLTTCVRCSRLSTHFGGSV